MVSVCYCANSYATGGGGSGATAVVPPTPRDQFLVSIDVTGSIALRHQLQPHCIRNETTAKVVRFDKANKELELTDIVGTMIVHYGWSN